MTTKQRNNLIRIIVSLALFLIIELIPFESFLSQPYALYAEFAAFLIPYIIAGHDVIAAAFKHLFKGLVFDEDFLMVIATFGAFALVFFPDSNPHMAEGAAVMIFFQIGEWFQGYAVGKSRKSIKDMMDIAPEYANLLLNDNLEQVDPYEVSVGDVIVVKPGERVPLDGIVLKGSSQLDTSALTGESLARTISAADEIFSGCINIDSTLTIEVTKPYEESTVSRILELVENAAEKKARTENFITRFARYYTPIVVGLAVVLAIVPPLFFGQSWSDWVERALCFLVVSCPCALVISVPLSFFGGIGGASRLGILVKGSNYMETLASVDTVVFDKTGTLTQGTFAVTNVFATSSFNEDQVLELAACVESLSDYLIAKSVLGAYDKPIDQNRLDESIQIAGRGVSALVDGRIVKVGNAQLMEDESVPFKACSAAGTILYVACDGEHIGTIVIADVPKQGAKRAIEALHKAGVSKTVMLTGDLEQVAEAVSCELGIDEYHAQLMPQDKVSHVERMLNENAAKSKLAFVGDGINDAPVLARSDCGIAMGAIGSDAAIEAADIVLMDDDPENIAKAIRIAKKTMKIVWQNIIFAIGVKIIILILAAIGLANMWLAVFGDVGVCVIAILNAMRAMRVGKL